jgi:phosphorylase kinase gamma subunit
VLLSDSCRGVSSVVRRCVHRATGDEFAVKIMEVTAERLSPEQLEEVREATRRETHILRQVAGHPHISEAASPVSAS